jgi:amino acid transporter
MVAGGVVKQKRELSLFDMTNIVVGSIIGADIYIASALTAGMLGPFSLVIWLIAGVCAVNLALVFAYCSHYVPRVGGPFAFVSAAFDDFFGFLTGWSMWIAEIMALPVFAIAFASYLQYIVPLDPLRQVALKGAFISVITIVNIRGVRAAGRVNDALTIIKLFPLLILVGAGFLFFAAHPDVLVQNYLPFAPLGFGSAGTAFVLIFWAYAGFELGTLPAEEVRDPRHTIPKAILFGMLIVTIFYMATNFVVYGTTSWAQLAATPTPLLLVGGALLGTTGALVMAIGAMVSVSGSDESGTLGTARLSYAMAIDGLFPKPFARLHERYRTPYVGLAVQGLIAFVLSNCSGIPALISFSVFCLAFSFMLTCFALVVIGGKNRKKPLFLQHVIPWTGILICGYLLYSTSLYDKIIGMILILAGIVIYVFFSPKQDIFHLKEMFLSEEAVFVRRLERRDRFLANFLLQLRRLYHAIRTDHPDTP